MKTIKNTILDYVIATLKLHKMQMEHGTQYEFGFDDVMRIITSLKK